jgi:hypothetical protein
LDGGDGLVLRISAFVRRARDVLIKLTANLAIEIDEQLESTRSQFFSQVPTTVFRQ